MPPSVAPLVAGWDLRLGAKAGPLGPVSAGSGEQAAGRVEVELLVDGQWQIITPYVMTRDGSQRIAITSGQANEGSQVQAARCAFQLNNRDGRFTPRNPLSPLYGKIGRNQQIRVSVPLGNDKSYRFWGEVPAWPQSWDTTGTDVWVAVDAAGPLRRLGQGTAITGSAMRTALGTGDTTNQVVAYWPCEDASGSTSIGSSVSGVPPMSINGTPTLATNSDFVCSSALPTMGTASFSASIPTYSVGGTVDATNPFSTMLRFLDKIPQAGATNGQVLAAFTWSGSVPRWEVYYSTAGSGQIGLRGRDSTGAVTLDTGTGGTMNGNLIHVTASLDISGGILFEYGLSLLAVGSTTPTTIASTSFGPTNGLVTSVTVAPGHGLPDTVIGHVSVQVSASGPPTDTALVAAIIAAHAGETAAARIQRLCGVAGLAFELIGTASDTVLMGTQLPGKVVDLIQAAALADGGRLYERTTAFGLGYRTRVSLENQTADLALSYSGNNLSEVPTPQDDDAYTRNDITVSRTGGSSARATLTSGTLSVQDPPNGVGQYDDSVTLNVQSDSTLPDQAGWRLHLGTVDEARYPKISINLAHPSITASSTIRSSALGLRPGDRITVSGMPAGQAPDDISQLLLGQSEVIDNFQHLLSFNCQPESPYRVAVTDDTVYGRVDTDGSQLWADAAPADTTLLVVATSGPLWTTDPAEVPFPIRVGGETMTVTQITSGINDTFTRSVSNDWGTADTGQVWSTSGASASDYAVNGSVGQHSQSSVNVARRTVIPALTADFDVTVTTSTAALATGGSQFVGLLGRYADTSNFYLARLEFTTTQTCVLTIRKTVATVDTQLAGVTVPGLTHAASTRFAIRFQASGTTFKAKAWLAAAREPDNWHLTTTDSSLFAAGSIGVRSILASTNTNVLPLVADYDGFQQLTPQAFTVVRSLNGVVKPQPAGTDVRLAQPAIAAL